MLADLSKGNAVILGVLALTTLSCSGATFSVRLAGREVPVIEHQVRKRLLLRHYGTGEFFKGEGAWTPLPKAACGFEDYVKAIAEAQKLGLTNVEAIMEGDDGELRCGLSVDLF
jgi:hypothetical protein